jgi:hypothetical protein
MPDADVTSESGKTRLRRVFAVCACASLMKVRGADKPANAYLSHLQFTKLLDSTLSCSTLLARSTDLSYKHLWQGSLYLRLRRMHPVANLAP